MKPLKLILSTLIVIALLNSCEKKENNPFLGSWENSETTAYGSVVATMTFRADMTMTFTFALTLNNQTTTTNKDYTYSYTDTEITVQEAGKPEETTDYMISGNSLVLSFGGMGLTTFTKK
ncbi:MAG: lipocalin family protein [Bacteroidales bacterium]|nr:lipocalin family protein [Bacteroidales bacterium]